MKILLKLLILVISILIISVPVFAKDLLITSNQYASNSIGVQLNGEYIDFTDENGNKVEPQIINDRTMVPVRKIFEVLGAKVEYEPSTKVITATKEDLEIVLQINNNIATVTKENEKTQEIALDSVPVIVDNRTLVPVRFIAESLNQKVGWDSYNRNVIIIDTSIIAETLRDKTPNFYEYLTADFGKISSFDMDIDLIGEEKVESDTLNIDGNMNIKLSDKAISMDIDLKLMEIGSHNADEIKSTVIINFEDKALYYSSPMLEGFEDKWIKFYLNDEEYITSFGKLINTLNTKNKVGLDLFEEVLVNENNLTITSYTELQTAIQMLPLIMGDDNFKISGTKSNRIYKYNLDLTELIKRMPEKIALQNLGNVFDLKLSFEVTADNNVAKTTKAIFDYKVNQYGEVSEGSIQASGVFKTCNQNVNIKMPEEKDILVVENIEFPDDSIGGGNTSTEDTNNDTTTDLETELLDLINKKRVEYGLSKLSFDASLQKVAKIKVEDLVVNNYFSHYSPIYGAPDEMLDLFGISYKILGENIAANSTLEGAVEGWMNSQGHRENILNNSFNLTGIGVAKVNNGYVMVQIFVGR